LMRLSVQFIFVIVIKKYPHYLYKAVGVVISFVKI
jgi:hypothetical protein